MGVEREFVACDPAHVVSGSSVEELTAAWEVACAEWRGAGPGVPVGIGYLSYDLGRRFETIRGRVQEPSGWPDLEFRFYRALWMRDARSGVARILAVDADAAARLAAALRDGPDADESADLPPPGIGALAPVEEPAQHVAAVSRILGYLRAGDAYQVNLARRLVAPVADAEDPLGWALFARLQHESPAPHALWFADPAAGTCLVGNSPERFLHVAPDGRIETRPIKGTRPRHDDGAGDAEAARALAADPKDRAEHVMIVDLERNDLGRVCTAGSVVVEDLMRVVSLPTVHHLVTTVRGRLRAEVCLPTALPELLRATFPGGSVTGAPKIRAMEIIDELEPARRGPYTGATGWLGAAGDLDLAVAIRTASMRDGRLTLWVGGGIVVDSEPAAELRETDAKAEAFQRLARLAASGATHLGHPVKG